MSSRADGREHQSKVSQSKACFGSSVVKVGNVNVRTLAGKEGHAGKAEFLAEELSRLSIALCGLCEVRWPGQGQKQVGTHSVHYSGGTTRHHDVALAQSQAASQCLQGCSPISDRIITATFRTALTPLTAIQVYAPTNCASPDVKDACYQQLQQQLDEEPNANLLLPMGDFNAKLGCEAQLWGGATGRFGLPALTMAPGCCTCVWPTILL